MYIYNIIYIYIYEYVYMCIYLFIFIFIFMCILRESPIATLLYSEFSYGKMGKHLRRGV